MTLALMQLPPVQASHGGSQRAWYLLNALAKLAPVDFVLLYPPAYAHAADADLTPVHAVARSVTRVPIPEWNGTAQMVRRMPKRIGRWGDLARMGTPYAPTFSDATLARIAQALPATRTDLLFAGRLPIAHIADALIDRGLLQADRKVVDFDDIQSRFLRREADAEAKRGIDRRLIDHIQTRKVERAEARIANAWDAVSVCSDEDIGVMTEIHPDARTFRVPNVIDRERLATSAGRPATLLFVGNLGFGPNVHGLTRFVDEAWPQIQKRIPGIRLRVVGLNPSEALATRLREAQIDLCANVPSVEPYYAEADVVLAPILFGGGTRIKILEAMAYGRAVVSTTIGAEGLGVTHGVDAMIADTMADFADAVVSLASDPGRATRMAEAGRALQQTRFGPPAMATAIRAMTEAAPLRPAPGPRAV